MTTKHYDYLLVGQGLAGSLLGYSLLKRGCSVKIVDNYEQPSSSRVAAGIYNPVTGRKLVKTWLADTIFPFLKTYYTELESELGKNFFHPMPMFRPFPNQEVKDYLLQETAMTNYGDFGQYHTPNDSLKSVVKSELGGVMTDHSGWVDLPLMLDTFKEYFEKKQCLLQHLFDYQGLHLESNTYQVNNECTLSFNKLIFCEGFYGRNNPYFSWLPFNPVKGEVLRVKFKEDISLKEMINQGVFVIPLSDGRARVGATYSWHELDWVPTTKGKLDLLEKYHKLMLADIDIEEHLAGVRPATKDRRPLVGIHPKYTNLGIFNGLGSKGVSLAPYFAEQLVDFLVNKKELDPEVNINRFGSLYLGQKQS